VKVSWMVMTDIIPTLCVTVSYQKRNLPPRGVYPHVCDFCTETNEW
jgi:hypothetical protein